MNQCVVCKNTENNKFISKIDGYIMGSFFDIYNCEYCKSSWANPHHSDGVVYDFIYRNAEIAPGYSRYYSFYNEIKKSFSPWLYLSLREEMYYGVFRYFRYTDKKKLKVLDVGCGMGYMTYALNKMGHNCEGIDLSVEAITKAKHNFGDYYYNKDFFDINLDYENKYDVICMLEIIEHVDDPIKYLEQAKKLVKKDGVIIVTTPNKDWYQKNVTWGSDIPEVHLTWFSEKGLHHIGKSLNLKSYKTNFMFYNIFIGSVLKPKSPTNISPSIFTKRGDILFVPYTKSKIRIIAEKLYVYSILIFVKKLVSKIKEFLIIVFFRDLLSLSRSHTSVYIYENN